VGNIDEEPSSIEDAMASDIWKEFMEKELAQLKRLGIYEVVDLPAEREPIQSKWVWRIKRDEKKDFVKAKFHLIVKGFTQQPGIDYLETFAPVVYMDMLRLLFALATAYGLLIHIVNIVRAYLNAQLKEAIYLQQPSRFEDGSKKV